jgi:hypothetical protein
MNRLISRLDLCGGTVRIQTINRVDARFPGKRFWRCPIIGVSLKARGREQEMGLGSYPAISLAYCARRRRIPQPRHAFISFDVTGHMG